MWSAVSNIIGTKDQKDSLLALCHSFKNIDNAVNDINKVLISVFQEKILTLTLLRLYQITTPITNGLFLSLLMKFFIYSIISMLVNLVVPTAYQPVYINLARTFWLNHYVTFLTTL